MSRSLLFNANKLKIILMRLSCTEINNCEKSEIKHYICLNIFLKGCLALSNQTERQAEIKPVVVDLVETQYFASRSCSRRRKILRLYSSQHTPDPGNAGVGRGKVKCTAYPPW